MDHDHSSPGLKVIGQGQCKNVCYISVYIDVLLLFIMKIVHQYTQTKKHWVMTDVRNSSVYCDVISCATRRGVRRDRGQRQRRSPARVDVVTRSVWPRSLIQDSFSSFLTAKILMIIQQLQRQWREAQNVWQRRLRKMGRFDKHLLIAIHASRQWYKIHVVTVESQQVIVSVCNRNTRWEMHAGRVACCPPMIQVQYAPRALLMLEKTSSISFRKKAGQTDERTDARPLHYAYRLKRPVQ